MEKADEKHFFDAIGRPDLKEIITPLCPWAYFSMEIGLPNFSFAGGLGILAGDTFLQAAKLDIPFVGVTLFYPTYWNQHVSDFSLTEKFSKTNPEIFNFTKETEILLLVNNDRVYLDVYSKEMNKKKIIALFEPGLAGLYHGDNGSEHRIYQETVLGFGGYIALRKMGFTPSIFHLNESSTVFAAIAHLDDLCANGLDFDKAYDAVRNKTILTNHTLVKDAIAYFPKDFFEHYAFKNIKTEAVKKWINSIFEREGGSLRLTVFALELAGKLNGVSKIHSKIASKSFKRIDGSDIYFSPITNGIYMQRWIYRDLFRLYREKEVADEFDIPNKDFGEKINGLDLKGIFNLKKRAKDDLVGYLRERKDQYNNPVDIPEGVRIGCWAKRFAGYKRPTMIFEDKDRLIQILEKLNMHLIISGDVNLTSQDMRQEVRQVLSIVNEDKRLSQRVHFVQDYDQILAKYLTAGADVWLNTPVVGNEACGTSWMKAIGNLAILISTPDGGVADEDSGAYLKITGANYEEEVESLYKNLERAGEILSDKNQWFEFVKSALKTYLPTISGGRMVKEYLRFIF